MATQKQLMDALRKADAAGDDAAAKLFAKKIDPVINIYTGMFPLL